MPREIFDTGIYEIRNVIGGGEFWKATINGNAVTIHFGKIGGSGTRASREFRDFREAKEFVENRLKKKIEEGYVLSTPSE